MALLLNTLDLVEYILNQVNYIKVALLLNVLDLVGAYTHIDGRIFSLLQELSALEAPGHARVQRKARQIAANFNDNLAEHSKEEVMPHYI